ncbi:hypothetical protein ACPOL_3402 [Acidisarcina polymorpha]|uniref:Uncharacterized protein n=1 Tax=Acidisarcina polymorpha TaxID=2211140 RepID=A0A2Z5G0W9_9BACT|nr:hypothetical protein [Acidisarcina polymorpha]AXC12689.1 hypothetical protein ACPOL_3402 [Acidisarcina polymorpha]
MSVPTNATVAAKDSKIVFHKPFVDQTKGGQRESVQGRFALLRNNTVSTTTTASS